MVSWWCQELVAGDQHCRFSAERLRHHPVLQFTSKSAFGRYSRLNVRLGIPDHAFVLSFLTYMIS